MKSQAGEAEADAQADEMKCGRPAAAAREPLSSAHASKIKYATQGSARAHPRAS